MGKTRARTGELVSAKATCQRCNFSANGKNALALAARHHDAFNHRVVAEVTTRTTYGLNLGSTSKDKDQKAFL